MKASTLLRNITFFTKDAERSAQFFIDVFGLKINQFSHAYSELLDSNNTKIVFLKVDNDAYTRTSYNPLLTFNVQNFDAIKTKLENYDIQYDGEIQNNDFGKYLCIKSPEGIMCVAYEAKHPELDEDDISVDINEESKLDPNSSEIRNILDKLKL